jgi:hypothetical protein
MLADGSYEYEDDDELAGASRRGTEIQSLKDPDPEDMQKCADKKAGKSMTRLVGYVSMLDEAVVALGIIAPHFPFHIAFAALLCTVVVGALSCLLGGACHSSLDKFETGVGLVIIVAFMSSGYLQAVIGNRDFATPIQCIGAILVILGIRRVVIEADIIDTWMIFLGSLILFWVRMARMNINVTGSELFYSFENEWGRGMRVAKRSWCRFAAVEVSNVPIPTQGTRVMVTIRNSGVNIAKLQKHPGLIEQLQKHGYLETKHKEHNIFCSMGSPGETVGAQGNMREVELEAPLPKLVCRQMHGVLDDKDDAMVAGELDGSMDKGVLGYGAHKVKTLMHTWPSNGVQQIRIKFTLEVKYKTHGEGHHKGKGGDWTSVELDLTRRNIVDLTPDWMYADVAPEPAWGDTIDTKITSVLPWSVRDHPFNLRSSGRVVWSYVAFLLQMGIVGGLGRETIVEDGSLIVMLVLFSLAMAEVYQQTIHQAKQNYMKWLSHGILWNSEDTLNGNGLYFAHGERWHSTAAFIMFTAGLVCSVIRASESYFKAKKEDWDESHWLAYGSIVATALLVWLSVRDAKHENAVSFERMMLRHFDLKNSLGKFSSIDNLVIMRRRDARALQISADVELMLEFDATVEASRLSTADTSHSMHTLHFHRCSKRLNAFRCLCDRLSLLCFPFYAFFFMQSD